MRALKIAGLALLGIWVWGAAAAPVLGQQFVPLRYDLRRPPRRYMPGLPYNLYPYASYGYSPYGSGPAVTADPYSFEAIRSRNYFVTGNVRAGKAFQGHTPYVDSGGQFTTNLPSTRLSEFRRDSIGIEDLGTGVEYGLPLPYFPYSSEVTTPASAAQRFAPGEYYAPPYVTPYGTEAMRLSPEAYARGQDAIALWTPETLLAGEGGGLAMPAEAALPPDFWEWMAAAAEEEAPPPSPETVWGAEGPDASIYGLMGALPGMGALPDNLYYGPFGAMEPEPAEPLPGGSILYWLRDEQALPPEAAEGEEPAEILPAYSPLGPVPWADTDPIVREVTVITASPYAEWVRKAHEAMRQADYKEADRLYNNALVLDPTRPVALFGRVHALVGLGSYNQAALLLARHLAKHPDWAKQTPDLRGAYPEQDVYDRAVESLQATVKSHPESATHNLMLGYMLYAAGRKAEARPYLESAAAAVEKRQAAQVLLDAIAAAP